MTQTTYSVDVFHTLRMRYPKWDDLSKYLQSEEGGYLSVLTMDNDMVHYIVRYDKAISNMSLPHVRWFRSVVWDSVANLPVSVAPPKASVGVVGGYDTEPTAKKVYDEMQCQDNLEGTMIAVFHSRAENGGGDSKIATRSKVGASGTFYSEKSFQDMWNDALKRQNSSNEELVAPLTGGVYATFGSYLLQHPEHRVVKKHAVARIWRIHTGYAREDGIVVFDEGDVDATVASANSPTKVDAPATDTMSVQEWVEVLAKKNGWDWQGIMVKDGKGGRWRVRPTAFNMVRFMRGESRRADVRFAKMREQNLVDTYLYYYPEDTKEFRLLENKVRTITQQLYNTYVSVNIKKEMEYSSVLGHFRKHITVLHRHYKENLRPLGKSMNIGTVIEYVNTMPWKQVLHMMNYKDWERIRGGGPSPAPL